MNRLMIHAAVLMCCTIWTYSAHAERRVALVIGNSAYQSVSRLENPQNDAKAMAETLRGLGFSLIGDAALTDLDKPGFDNAIQRFGRDIQGADVALFYYAGHGVQIRGENFLVPVTANPTREADVDFQMVNAQLVLRQMEGAGTKLNFVILDACRNNPFGGRGLRAADGGLAQLRAPEGTLISYATQPGSVAQDGADGNSPYTKALVQTIKQPGLSVFEAFNLVGLSVMQATGNAQQPWVSTSPIKGSFSFAAATTAIPLNAPARAPETDRPAGNNVASAYWQTRQLGTCGAYQAFIQSFKESFEARLAEEQVKTNCASPPKTASVTRFYRVPANVSDGKLNIRSGPGVGYALVAAIPAGASDVTVGLCRPSEDRGSKPWC